MRPYRRAFSALIFLIILNVMSLGSVWAQLSTTTTKTTTTYVAPTTSTLTTSTAISDATTQAIQSFYSSLVTLQTVVQQYLSATTTTTTTSTILTRNQLWGDVNNFFDMLSPIAPAESVKDEPLCQGISNLSFRILLNSLRKVRWENAQLASSCINDPYCKSLAVVAAQLPCLSETAIWSLDGRFASYLSGALKLIGEERRLALEEIIPLGMLVADQLLYTGGGVFLSVLNKNFATIYSTSTPVLLKTAAGATLTPDQYWAKHSLWFLDRRGVLTGLPVAKSRGIFEATRDLLNFRFGNCSMVDMAGLNFSCPMPCGLSSKIAAQALLPTNQRSFKFGSSIVDIAARSGGSPVCSGTSGATGSGTTGTSSTGTSSTGTGGGTATSTSQSDLRSCMLRAAMSGGTGSYAGCLARSMDTGLGIPTATNQVDLSGVLDRTCVYGDPPSSDTLDDKAAAVIKDALAEMATEFDKAATAMKEDEDAMAASIAEGRETDTGELSQLTTQRVTMEAAFDKVADWEEGFNNGTTRIALTTFVSGDSVQFFTAPNGTLSISVDAKCAGGGICVMGGTSYAPGFNPAFGAAVTGAATMELGRTLSRQNPPSTISQALSFITGIFGGGSMPVDSSGSAPCASRGRSNFASQVVAFYSCTQAGGAGTGVSSSLQNTLLSNPIDPLPDANMTGSGVSFAACFDTQLSASLLAGLVEETKKCSQMMPGTDSTMCSAAAFQGMIDGWNALYEAMMPNIGVTDPLPFLNVDLSSLLPTNILQTQTTIPSGTSTTTSTGTTTTVPKP